MPKLKDVNDLDVEALDAVEYSTEEYTTYTGEVPPVGIELTGYVKRLWWTRTAPKQGGGGDDPMLKVLWVAADNDGDNEEYNECPFWLNAPLVPGAKFRWAPFLDVYGLTLRQIKSNTFVASKEDQNGAPIERIGTWKPGEESDSAWCRIITGQEPYNGEMQARVKEWLMWDEEGTVEPGAEDGEEAGAEDGDGEEEGVELFEDDEGNLVDAEGNFYDEDGVLIEPEPESEPEPARTRRAPARAAKPAAKAPARAARTAPAPKAARTAPATTRTRAAAPKAARAATAKAPAGRGRGRAAAARNEPPF